jgi:Tfp pilus assembly protein FimV
VLLRRRAVAAGLVLAVAGGALALGFGVGRAGAEIAGSPPAAPVYVVQPGDTLWAIAGRLAPEVGTERAVAALRKAAGGAALTPGQRIVVPSALR